MDDFNRMMYMEGVLSIRSGESQALRRLAMYPPIKVGEWGIENDNKKYHIRRMEIHERAEEQIRQLALQYPFSDTIDVECEVVEPKQLNP